MLGKFNRIHVKNGLGQTIAVNGIIVKVIRQKFASDGSLTIEASEAEIANNGSTVVNGAFYSGTAQDNSTNKYLLMNMSIKIIAPASSNGDVTIYVQESTDNTQWPDDGAGFVVAVINFTTSGTKWRNARFPV